MLQATLELDPKDRLTIEECFEHPGLAQDRERYERRQKDNNHNLSDLVAKSDTLPKTRRSSDRECRRKSSPKKIDENAPNNSNLVIDTDQKNASKKFPSGFVIENVRCERFGEVETLIQSSDRLSDMETDRNTSAITSLVSSRHPKPVSSDMHLSSAEGDNHSECKDVDRTKPTKISIGSTFTDLFQDKGMGAVVHSQKSSDNSEKDSFVKKCTSPTFSSASTSPIVSSSPEMKNGKVLYNLKQN